MTVATAPETDALLDQMGAATVRHVWAIPELSDREKVFLLVVADICQPALGRPFELHVRRALASGMSTADLRALISLVSYDAGYHAALAAMDRLAEIETALDLPRSASEQLSSELTEFGPDAPASPLPEAVQTQLAQLDEHFLDHFRLQSRMRTPTGPGTLSIRERAFATMSVDVHYQTLEESFEIHVGRALGAGATPDDVRAVLRFNAMFGTTRAWRAWKALNRILA
ncbi:carboxymuconolactone decarboxylase family protein [Hamadaea tsunoensis]|uniref:carboxymuconolactone decarboxylase family protein n=1 Tax=Hamadaea tsunoensis TaxID=53368 RepID=UPI000412A1A3|nr:carboxymuconolactone decarboxylase family protein [Hamadaea tsunoensis]